MTERMVNPDERCRICGEPRSAHVATEKGPYTHPREARGEGTYVNRSYILGRGPWHDDEYVQRWEFVPYGPVRAGDEHVPGERPTSEYSPLAIAVARDDGRLRVDSNGLGWIHDMEPDLVSGIGSGKEGS